MDNCCIPTLNQRARRARRARDGSVIERIGDFVLEWGESLLWDDRRQRLYFVDTLGRTIHWLDGGAGDLHTVDCPTMPSGMVNDEAGRLVATGDDGRPEPRFGG
jgi:sugar lactone lactonase YvrE